MTVTGLSEVQGIGGFYLSALRGRRAGRGDRRTLHSHPRTSCRSLCERISWPWLRFSSENNAMPTIEQSKRITSCTEARLCAPCVALQLVWNILEVVE
jgi:hypothetical protein